MIQQVNNWENTIKEMIQQVKGETITVLRGKVARKVGRILMILRSTYQIRMELVEIIKKTSHLVGEV